MEPLHQPGDIVAERYRINGLLGRGAICQTFVAQAVDAGELVAIEMLACPRSEEKAILESVQREASVLPYLNHPGIANYFDVLTLPAEKDTYIYLVRELVEGQSLADALKRGWQPQEGEVRAIAAEVLDSLNYLHWHKPPVFHRNIKPGNLILRRDGSIVLVDFGAIRDIYRSLMGGAIAVGSDTYRPLEQLRGHIYPASDLYSLGATLVALLKGSSSTEVPSKTMLLDWRSQLDLSPELATWLERVLQPDPGDRYHSAEAALQALRGVTSDKPETASSSSHSQPPRVPVTSPQGKQTKSPVSDPEEIHSEEFTDDFDDLEPYAAQTAESLSAARPIVESSMQAQPSSHPRIRLQRSAREFVVDVAPHAWSGPAERTQFVVLACTSGLLVGLWAIALAKGVFASPPISLVSLVLGILVSLFTLPKLLGRWLGAVFDVMSGTAMGKMIPLAAATVVGFLMLTGFAGLLLENFRPIGTAIAALTLLGAILVVCGRSLLSRLDRTHIAIAPETFEILQTSGILPPYRIATELADVVDVGVALHNTARRNLSPRILWKNSSEFGFRRLRLPLKDSRWLAQEISTFVELHQKQQRRMNQVL
jgi:serine/threonine protein kinase